MSEQAAPVEQATPAAQAAQAAPLLTVKSMAPAGTEDTAKSMAQIIAEIEAEQAGTAANDEPANDGKPAPERDKDGKFKPKEKAEAEKPDKPEKPANDDDKRSHTVKGLLEERKALRAKVAAREAAAAEKEAAAEAKAAHLQSLVDELEKGAQKNVRKLAESGDMDGVAQALGFRDWNHVNEHHARMLASPEYRRIRALEEERAVEKREREEWQRQQAAQHAETQRVQQVTEAMDELGGMLQKHEDPEIAGLADDGDFVATVYNQIDHVYKHGRRQIGKPGDDNYSPALPPGSLMDTDDAAKLVVEAARQKYSRFHAVFGGRPTSEAETRSRVSQNRAVGNPPERKASKHVSTNTATEASEPMPENMTDAQWKAWVLAEAKKNTA